MNAKWCAIAVLTVIVGAFVAHASDLIPKYEYELDEVLLLRVDLTDPNTSGRADPCSITYTVYDVNTADDTLTAVTGIEDVNMTGPRVSKPGVYMSLVTLSEPNFAEGGTYMVIIDVNMAGVLGEKSGVFTVVAAEVDEIYARIAPLVPTDFNNVGITANNLHVHLKAADDNAVVDANMVSLEGSTTAVANMLKWFSTNWATVFDDTNDVPNARLVAVSGSAGLADSDDNQADMRTVLDARGMTQAWAGDVATTNSTVATNLDAAVSSRSSHSAANVLTALGTGSWITAMPWNAAWDAEIESETNDALVAIHLDHLFAADYDPASKPGVATALLNELIESDSGVSKFTANSLEEAGGTTPEEIWAYIIDGSVTAKQWAASSLASMIGIVTITDHGTTRTNKYYKQDDTTIQYQITYRESNGSRTTGGEIEP